MEINTSHLFLYELWGKSSWSHMTTAAVRRQRLWPIMSNNVRTLKQVQVPRKQQHTDLPAGRHASERLLQEASTPHDACLSDGSCLRLISTHTAVTSSGEGLQSDWHISPAGPHKCQHIFIYIFINVMLFVYGTWCSPRIRSGSFCIYINSFCCDWWEMFMWTTPFCTGCGSSPLSQGSSCCLEKRVLEPTEPKSWASQAPRGNLKSFYQHHEVSIIQHSFWCSDLPWSFSWCVTGCLSVCVDLWYTGDLSRVDPVSRLK